MLLILMKMSGFDQFIMVFYILMCYIFAGLPVEFFSLNLVLKICGPVVQLVRMPACHAGGRRFEPVPGRQFF